MKSAIFPFANEIGVDPSDRDAWLAQRQLGVGGSDAATIMGANPWKQTYALWLEKREGAASFDNEAMYWGRALESSIRVGFSDKMALTVRPLSNSVFIHPDLPFVRANLDGAIVDNVPKALVYEGKTSNAPDQWGPTGSDEYPEQYLWQVQHYLAVTNAPLAHLAVLLFGRDFRTYQIPRDETLIDALLNNETSFWKSVQDGTPPEVDPDGADALELIRHRFPRKQATITLSQQALELAIVWQETKKEVASGKKRVDLLRASLELAMEGHQVAAFDGDSEGRQLIITDTSTTIYDMPDDVKQQYARKSPVIRLDFKTPKDTKAKEAKSK